MKILLNYLTFHDTYFHFNTLLYREISSYPSIPNNMVLPRQFGQNSINSVEIENYNKNSIKNANNNSNSCSH